MAAPAECVRALLREVGPCTEDGDPPQQHPLLVPVIQLAKGPSWRAVKEISEKLKAGVGVVWYHSQASPVASSRLIISSCRGEQVQPSYGDNSGLQVHVEAGPKVIIL